jgi:hypothetical protein
MIVAQSAIAWAVVQKAKHFCVPWPLSGGWDSG